ncbi:hypothetical protein G4H71_14940 [Rhodococcus triatomae]|nr:DUF5709 domain-containing protein [Rhodococcus triatomae]QNG19932.1 hypothetical protein G4H72_15435 [Rhodococcus triatomae]QNG24153.1 hypothetical protein G4H71_14940 [Rhodococcus triatomae]
MTYPSDSTREGDDADFTVDEDNQLQPEDSLVDRGVDDVLDEGYSPPDRPPKGYALTDSEERAEETLDERLAEEEPDVGADPDAPQYVEDREIGARRAGRLLAEDEGVAEDTEDELVATDVGIDGGAASAEEAAVHVIDDEYDGESRDADG